MRTIQRTIVAAMIFSEDKKLLLVQKNPVGGGVYIDCWHLPGGGVEVSETKEEACKREVQEEVGLDIAKYELQLVDEEGEGTSEKKDKETGEKVLVEMQFTVYKVIIVDKKSEAIAIAIALSDELASFQWFSKDEIKKIKVTPPSVTLFQKLGYL